MSLSPINYLEIDQNAVLNAIFIPILTQPFSSRALLLVLRARMFKNQDMKVVKKILTYCYLGDWWVLYQLGRNSNTHFFRYLLQHIEHDFVAKEKRAKREEKRRQHRRHPINGANDFNSEESEEDQSVSVVGSNDTQNGSSGNNRRRHHKIAMAYNA